MKDALIRIVIVEDQRIVAADLQSTLEGLGYSVAGSAASGEDAVAKVLGARPDLVLMDVRLEGEMDGIEAAKLIRQTYDVPIVYLTAYADEETIVRAKQTSPYSYLVKPFNERELRAAIEVALYKHSMDARLREQDVRLAEERAMRRASEAAEKRLKMLIEGVKDYSIFMLDKSGHVATWNSGAQRILHYSIDEILGKHLRHFYSRDDVERGVPEAILEKALCEGRVEVEGQRLRRDGSPFWADGVIAALHDEAGQHVGFACISRDLSEKRWQKEAEQMLDQVTVLLSSSLEVCDNLSRASAQVVPLLADSCLVDLVKENGGLAVCAAAYSPEIPGLEKKIYQSTTRRSAVDYALSHGGHVLHQHIFEIDWDPNAAGPISYLGVPIELRGKRLGVVELLRRSSRGGYTAAHLGVAQELARRIGIALDNARLYCEAQRAVEARDEFLAIASHELRTPLTPLQLQLEAIERSLTKAGLRDKRLFGRIERCSRQTARLTRLVESLLDVTRIRSGQLTIDPEELDLCTLVSEVAERFESEASEVKTRIEVTHCEELHGRFDRGRMEQVVTNLLSNALKYGAGKPIELDVRELDGAFRISVRDHGTGIPPDALDRIFGRFERASSTRHHGGLGLGLFITKRIVEAHGGTISVKSAPGDGATFTVTLPKRRAAA